MPAKTIRDFMKACQAAYDLLREDREGGALAFTKASKSSGLADRQVTKACEILRKALGDNLDRYRGKIITVRFKNATSIRNRTNSNATSPVRPQ